MQKTMMQLQNLNLIGITCRTNNTRIFETDPSTNIIAKIVQDYFHNSLAEKILHRKNPGTTYCIYTEYESDFTGDYTYFIGEEVTQLNDLPANFKALTIPAQNYVRFTLGPDKMPEVCIQAWKKIWQMQPAELGGERAYIADFEVYDERSSNHEKVVFDIYIGIK